MAKEYKEILSQNGRERGEIRSKEGEAAKVKLSFLKLKIIFRTMQSLTSVDSKLNKRLELILVIRKIILEYAAKRRDSLAKPLEEGFAEGFKLLSRKSESVKDVRISTTDYSPFIEMDGYVEIGWTEIYLQQKNNTLDYQCCMQLASCLEYHCQSL